MPPLHVELYPSGGMSEVSSACTEPEGIPGDPEESAADSMADSADPDFIRFSSILAAAEEIAKDTIIGHKALHQETADHNTDGEEIMGQSETAHRADEALTASSAEEEGGLESGGQSTRAKLENMQNNAQPSSNENTTDKYMMGEESLDTVLNTDW